jgi:hypothetical protein
VLAKGARPWFDFYDGKSQVEVVDAPTPMSRDEIKRAYAGKVGA